MAPMAAVTWTARTTGTTRGAGTTRAEGRDRRTTRPTGAQDRRKRPAWEEGRPLARRWSLRTLGTKRGEHAMVMAMVVMDRDRCAGEEDDRHNENDAGDDHHPRSDLVKPRRPCSLQMLWRRDRGGRLHVGFRYLGHLSIMPTHVPVIKPRLQQVTS